jgi:uncharacterized protein involved in response to NO
MGLFFFTFWPLFVFWQIGLNPLILHQHGAVNLVIGSFAIGFLLTALPRFTGTSKASRLDVAVLGIATVLEFVGLLMNFPGFAALIAALKFSYLIQFAIRRVQHAAQGMMPNKLWILLALTAVVIGNGGMAMVAHWPLLPHAEQWMSISKTLYSRGFLSGIFIGIGGRLVPMLTGVKTAPLKTNRIFHPLHPWLAGLFFAALLLEIWQLRVALILQLIAVAIEIIYLWRLWQFPIRGSRAKALWVASWLMVLEAIAVVCYPEYQIDLFHITFIGVFLAGTFTVSSHVLVMHDGLDQRLLNRFWPLGLVTVGLFLAMATRVLAKTGSYWRHLGYAGATVSLVLLLWGFYFIYLRPSVSNNGNL